MINTNHSINDERKQTFFTPKSNQADQHLKQSYPKSNNTYVHQNISKDVFYFYNPVISTSQCNEFQGTSDEKKIILEMTEEWNKRLSISDLCQKWKKTRPIQKEMSTLLIILFNVQGLNTHMTDVNILLNEHKPHIFILTGVGAASKQLPQFNGYDGMAQIGTNAYGGVAILYQKHLKCKMIEKELNFLLIELQTPTIPVYIGAIYVPPGSLPPFNIFNNCASKPFYIFGDFNAKHTYWNCNENNTSGVHIIDWIEETGNDLILPTTPTSKRSKSIIDFGITHDSNGWSTEVLREGTSDHWPILLQSPIPIENTLMYKETNWKIFKFFLSITAQYWNSLVYNFDTETFFSLFSSFLQSLHDRCSKYKSIDKFRPPWPPSLVLLARTVNKYRRSYRRSKTSAHLERLLIWKEIFQEERALYMEHKRAKKVEWLKEGNNIWKYVKNTFRPFMPSFKGLTIENDKITDPKKIVDVLANHYEEHFQQPQHDENNLKHINAINVFENLQYLPAIPLEQIKYQEVLREWKNLSPKKSTDSAGTSAFILKQLPDEYIQIMTVLFNKCSQEGSFPSIGKIAKVICLSKEGLYPTTKKLRPISLLPNIAKWFERIIHQRIIKWSKDQNIAIDEQSGFMQGRRLQTRILSLVENLRLTIAACNRPALTLFVDFLSAFDRMWHPALIKTLNDLQMPIGLLKWIHTWLRDRYLYISYAEENSRVIKMDVGAPQGSVLAATLFRLHVHNLPEYFFNLMVHMFADDLAIVLVGSLEKRFSQNITELEIIAQKAMKQLETFSNEYLLPVNVNKTKALLVHSVVSPSLPRLTYKNEEIEFVKSFKYLGVHITTKLGWGKYIQDRVTTIRRIYKGLKLILKKIPLKLISQRRKVFLAYALPHFCWLFSTWFYFTENQQKYIDHVYCSGIRMVYVLHGWDDTTTMILSREKSLYDYIYTYWIKLSFHLERSQEALSFQQSWQAFNIITSNNKSWYKSMGFRKNSKFPNRLEKRAQHTLNEWKKFETIHRKQFESFRRNTQYLNLFIYKYLLPP